MQIVEIIGWMAIGFLITRALWMLWDFLNRKYPSSNKIIKSCVFWIMYLFGGVSILYGALFYLFDSIHVKHVYERALKKMKTAYILGVTDLHFNWETDGGREIITNQYLKSAIPGVRVDVEWNHLSNREPSHIVNKPVKPAEPASPDELTNYHRDTSDYYECRKKKISYFAWRQMMLDAAEIHADELPQQ